MDRYNSILRNRIPRSKLILYGVILVALVVVIILLWSLLSKDDDDDDDKRSSNAKTGHYILEQVPLIDGYNNLPSSIMKNLPGQLAKFTFDDCSTEDYGSWCKTDLHRLQKGMVGTQVWVVKTPCNSQYKDTVAKTIQQIDLISRLVSKYKHDLKFITSNADIVEAFEQHKIGSMIGMDGGHAIDNKLAVLRIFYRLGVRYVRLTASCNTPWSASYANDDATSNLVLTDFGKVVVKEMNRLGMIIDVADSSEKAQIQVLQLSEAPCIFSSAAVYQLAQQNQNINDSVLDFVKKNNGLIMITFDGKLLGAAAAAVAGDKESTAATIENVIEQINFVRNKVGVDNVGIGAGFNSQNGIAIKNLDDSSVYPTLFDKLANPEKGGIKWQPQELKKLAGLNFQRVFKQVEKIRDKHTERPYENLIPASDITSKDATCYTT